MSKVGRLAMIMVIAVVLVVSGLPTRLTQAQEECVNTHMVFDGDTLSGIAKKYGVDMMELAELNGIENIRLIYIGDVLCLDGLATAVSTETGTDGEGDEPDTTEPDGEGDEPDTTEPDGEGDEPDTTEPDGEGEGDEPDTTEPDEDEGAPAQTGGGTPSNYIPPQYPPKADFTIEFLGKTYRTDNLGYYTVQSGDSLYAISSAFGVNAGLIMSLNQIADANLVLAGSRLFIPYPAPTPPQPGTIPVISFTPGQVGPGDTVVVEGFNYPANTEIEIFFEKQSEHRKSDLIETVTTDENGHFSTEVEVISEWTNGDPVSSRTVSISAYAVGTEFWAMDFFINSAWLAAQQK